MKQKQGFIQFILLAIAIVVGLIIFYFVLKALIGLIVTALLWTVGLAIIIGLIYVAYLLIKWLAKPKSKRR